MNAEITIRGYVVGPIWMPAVEAYKPFTYNLTRERQRWIANGTLRDHIVEIISDGDFRDCRIADGQLEITVVKNNRRRSRVWDLAKFPSIQDCLNLDWPGPDVDD